MGDTINPFPWVEIGVQAAEGLAGQLTAKQQFERQKKLMNIQNMNQRSLNEQGQQLQMKTWQETNYPAQVAMLKEAGLNPALLYSKGGAGGTTGSQGGGSAASGNAPQTQPMNISNILEMQQMKAQTALIEAQRRKTEAETPTVAPTAAAEIGAKEAGAEASKAGADKSRAEAEKIRVETEIQKIIESNTQREIDAGILHTIALTNKLVTDNIISSGQAESLILKAQYEAIATKIEIALTESKIKLTNAEINAITEKITQEWSKIGQGWENVAQKYTELDQRAKEIKIKEFEANIKAEYPNAGAVAGKIANMAYDTLEQMARFDVTGKYRPNRKVE